MSGLAFVLVVAGLYKVEGDPSSGAAHLVFVVGAEVVVFARHESLGRVRRAVRATHDRHFLQAFAHVRALDTATRARKEEMNGDVLGALGMCGADALYDQKGKGFATFLSGTPDLRRR